MAVVDVSKVITLTGHKDCVYTLTSSPDPASFFSAAGDGMVVLWELTGSENGQLIASVPNSIYSICTLPEKNQLVLGHNYEGIHIVDLNERRETGSMKITDSAIFALSYHGGMLFTGTADGDLILIDLIGMSVQGRIKKSSKSIRAIVSDGNHLAVGYSDHFIRIFDLVNRQLISEFKAHENSVFTLKYSPDGRYLLSGSRDARLKIWDRHDGYRLKDSIIAHLYTINDIDYRPDGKYFATCSMDKTIKIWEAEQFKLLKVIDKSRHGGHLTSVNKIFWSSYKNRLISCSDDRTISVWDLKFNARS
ncbi:MAG: WD40 repeat domain-containing protein [Cyclobacteriaceae bacterium]|nr:WD40 repeat domain-containing protein [Cyclobacteriaceae bacterium]